MSKAKSARVIKLVKSEYPSIEKGIACPPRTRKGLYWGFAEKMAVNDSFFLDFKRYNKSAAVSFKRYAEEMGWETIYRTFDDGVRVWRVK